MRIYAVPIEHEKAFKSFLKKYSQEAHQSGRAVFLTEEELAAVLSQTIIDIPDEDGNGCSA